MESLVETARQFDFAVLALTADDLVQSRGQTVLGPRDNVLFELGLFTGLLGRERTFILEDRSQSLKIPTDLFGVTMASYDGSRADKNFEAAVSPACTQVMGRIDELGPLHVGSLPEFCSLFRDAVRESLGLQRIWAEYKLEECLGQVRRLVSADELEYGENDHDLVMGHLYGNTSAGDWIHAVSYDELADWKDALLGVQYSDINFDTAKKGVKVERIFVYDDVAELRALRPVLDRQKSNRIKVRIACASGLDRGKLHHENRLILSVKALGRYTVWPEHSPDGKLIKATVSWNPRTIQRFERIYKIVRSVSKPWDARTKMEVGADAPGPSPDAVGLYHIAFKIGDDIEDLREAKRTLESQRVEIGGSADHTVSKSIYLKDPDGNELELYIDEDPAIWKADRQTVASIKPLEL